MTPEEITTAFATAATTFQPISGQPSDDDLTVLRDVLYPLLLDIPYNEDGTPNLIGLIEPTTSYTATWGTLFPPPPRPPAYPIIDDAATAVIRARREAEHAILVRDFASYKAAKRATAKFISKAVDKIWYCDLRYDRSFYTHVTAKQLLLHLGDNCGGLHPSELVNLLTDMLGFYATADGIPEYINMLEAAQRKLTHANLPMSDDQLLAIASTAVLASNHFPRPTHDWEAKPCVTKTWRAWKTHYSAAHIARKRQLLASGTAMPASTSNAFLTEDDTYLTEGTFARLDGYLDNLAAAATTECTTLQSLMEANAALVANVTALTTSDASLTAAYTTMAAIHRTGLHHPLHPRNNPAAHELTPGLRPPFPPCPEDTAGHTNFGYRRDTPV
eukprot:CCRYP_007353-RA/>CCRYP_007353-RA protein AED:0.44 eAED:1.00 QI:0/-1/0/1/-1/1/1/0/387